jgi:hypothetical protein
MISSFSIFDGTAVQLANEHNGSYSEMFHFAMLANMLCSFLPTLIIKDANSVTGRV